MILTIVLIGLLFYVHLGWCWANALVRLDASKSCNSRSYMISFILWPFSMLIWDARQQEHGYDDQY